MAHCDKTYTLNLQTFNLLSKNKNDSIAAKLEFYCQQKFTNRKPKNPLKHLLIAMHFALNCEVHKNFTNNSAFYHFSPFSK